MSVNNLAEGLVQPLDDDVVVLLDYDVVEEIASISTRKKKRSTSVERPQ